MRKERREEIKIETCLNNTQSIEGKTKEISPNYSDVSDKSVSLILTGHSTMSLNFF